MNVDGFQQVKNKKCTRRNIFDEVNDDLQHLAKEQRKATTFQDLRRAMLSFITVEETSREGRAPRMKGKYMQVLEAWRRLLRCMST